MYDATSHGHGQCSHRRKIPPRKPPRYDNRVHAFPDADFEPLPDTQGRSYPPIRAEDLPADVILARLLERVNLYIECEDGQRFCTAVENEVEKPHE